MEAALYLLPMEIKSIGLEDQKRRIIVKTDASFYN
jgi:hypothetical protein